MSGGTGPVPVPPPWDAKPELLALLAPDAGGLLADVAPHERGAVRLKPGGEALVAFTFRGRDRDGKPATLDGYVAVLGRARAAAVAGKWARLRPVAGPSGPGVRLLPGGGSVLFLFPNDRQLRGLRFVAGIDKVKRTLAGLPAIAEGGWRVRGRRSVLTTVRYKPERRFIARARLELKNDGSGAAASLPAFLRFYADDRGRRIDALARALREQGLGAEVPEPLGALVHGRLFVEREVEGRTLHAALLSGDRVDPAPLARALRRFHGTASGLPAGPDPETLRQRCASGLRELARCAPDAGPAATAVERLLAEALPPAARGATIHGDFHPQQVILSPAGPVLVDFERAGPGDPIQDAGNLAANLRSMAAAAGGEAAAAIHAFLEGFLEAAGFRSRERPASDLAFFEAVATVELALLRLRRLEPGWPDSVRRLIERAAAALEAAGTRHRIPEKAAPGPRRPAFFARSGDDAADARGFRWEVFHPRERGPWTGWIEHPAGLREYGLYDPATDAFAAVAPEEDPVLGAAIRSLAGARVVSFRPGRRAVLRSVDPGRPLWWKVLPPAKAARLRERALAAEALLARGGGDAFQVARLVDDRSAEGLLGFEEIGGRPLHDLLVEDDPGAPGALDASARALAAFQSAEASGPGLPEAPRLLPPEGWLELARPHLGAAAARFESGLALLPPPAAPPPALRPVHGDLHDRNLLVGAGAPGIIDLDLLHAGDPADDAGNLAAHVLLRALQRGAGAAAGRRDARRFLRSWRAAGGSSPRRAVDAVVARTLFRLAVIHHFRRRWRALAPALLKESARWSLATSDVS